MSNSCKFCGIKIVFDKHPKNDIKWVPFELLSGGEKGRMHLGRCKKAPSKDIAAYIKETGRDFSTLDELGRSIFCKYKHPASKIIVQEFNKSSPRLLALCNEDHSCNWIPITRVNLNLVAQTCKRYGFSKYDDLVLKFNRKSDHA